MVGSRSAICPDCIVSSSRRVEETTQFRQIALLWLCVGSKDFYQTNIHIPTLKKLKLPFAAIWLALT